jgi:hypothetical protein
MYLWSLHLRCIVTGPSPALPARPKYAMRTLPNKETPSMLLQPHSSVGSLLFIAPPLSLHRRGERREKLEKKKFREK